MKRLVSFILVLTLLFSLGISASATWGIEAKELYYRGISIYVNGTELIPQDVNGKSTEPFIIEGTTYLPVRALAGALGLSVGWDGTTNTITLTSGAEVNMGSGQAAKTKEIVSADVYYKDVKIYLDGAELIPTDVTGKYVEPFLMGGSTYLPLRAIATALGLEVGWDETTNTITLDKPAVEEPKPEPEMVWRLVEEKTTVTNRSGSEEFPLEFTLESFVRYNYDENGYLLSMSSDAFGLHLMDIELSYNDAGKLIAMSFISSGREIILDLEYNQSGAIETISAAIDGQTLIYSNCVYNGLGQLTTETVVSGDSTTIITYTYDDRGNCTQQYAVDNLGSWSKISSSYDAQGRVLSERTESSDGTLSESSTSYDENGNILSTSFSSAELNFCYNYTYDELGREILCEYVLNGESFTAETSWGKTGLTCTIITRGPDTYIVEKQVWAEHGHLLSSERATEGSTTVREYTYQLLPVCSDDELVNSLLDSLGYSR